MNDERKETLERHVSRLVSAGELGRAHLCSDCRLMAYRVYGLFTSRVKSLHVAAEGDDFRLLGTCAVQVYEDGLAEVARLIPREDQASFD